MNTFALFILLIINLFTTLVVFGGATRATNCLLQAPCIFFHQSPGYLCLIKTNLESNECTTFTSMNYICGEHTPTTYKCETGEGPCEQIFCPPDEETVTVLFKLQDERCDTLETKHWHGDDLNDFPGSRSSGVVDVECVNCEEYGESGCPAVIPPPSPAAVFDPAAGRSCCWWVEVDCDSVLESCGCHRNSGPNKDIQCENDHECCPGYECMINNGKCKWINHGQAKAAEINDININDYDYEGSEGPDTHETIVYNITTSWTVNLLIGAIVLIVIIFVIWSSIWNKNQTQNNEKC